MAKCDLWIELDDPEKMYAGGGTITGVVKVQADANVKCKGLEVSSGWKTHGRGNVDTGTIATENLFSGEWTAGEQTEYRFELPIADWPPSYHGHYLNVDHYIDARAKIPWGFDPKVSVPFLMRPTVGSEGAIKHSNATEISGTIGCIIAAVFVSLFVGIGGMVAIMTFPFGLILFLLVGGSGFGFWFFKKFLPKYLLGDVNYFIVEETLTPGQNVNGELVIQPRRNVPVNAITVHFQAREQCVSGSGSNRTTHKNVFFEKIVTLQESTTLAAGQEHRFKLDFQLPDNAPYSIDLSDNDLIWSAALRVDIPRWPDWTKEIALTVVPSGEAVDQVTDSGGEQNMPPLPVEPPVVGADGDSGSDITFAETAQHLWSTRQDREQVEMLVEAVSGLTFSIEAIVERRLLYSGEEDPHVYKDGYAVWAHFTDPPLPLVVYVPHELADEFERAGRDGWQGRGTIVGWDSQHGRLQVKLERPS